MNFSEKETICDLIIVDIANNLGSDSIDKNENVFISDYIVDLLNVTAEMKFARYEEVFRNWALKALENLFQLNKMNPDNDVWERSIERTFKVIKYYRNE